MGGCSGDHPASGDAGSGWSGPTRSVRTSAWMKSSGGTGESTQHSELAGVGHHVGQRSLEELRVADRRGERRVGEVGVQRSQRRMESYDLGGERRLGRWLELTAAQHRPRIAGDARHVPEQLVGRADVRPRPEVGEPGGRLPQRFLRAVGDGRDEVLQKTT